jgi:hypothetical protein
MKQVTVFLMMVLLGTAFVFAGDKADVQKDKEAIKKVILSAYCDGIANVGDPAAMQKGFHPGFNLIGLTGDKANTWKLPIYSWMISVEKRKKAGKYPPKEKVTFKFPHIDVVGTAALAKIHFYKGERLAYTDFLSLYKFNDGWKIVAKIYYEHPAPKAKK